MTAKVSTSDGKNIDKSIFFCLYQKPKSIFPAELLFNTATDDANAGWFYVEQEAYIFRVHVNGKAYNVSHVHVGYFFVGGEIALFQHLDIQFR